MPNVTFGRKKFECPIFWLLYDGTNSSHETNRRDVNGEIDAWRRPQDWLLFRDRFKSKPHQSAPSFACSHRSTATSRPPPFTFASRLLPLPILPLLTFPPCIDNIPTGRYYLMSGFNLAVPDGKRQQKTATETRRYRFTSGGNKRDIEEEPL